jgi:hypothetical protein
VACNATWWTLSKAKPLADLLVRGAARFGATRDGVGLVEGVERFEGAGVARLRAEDFAGLAGVRTGLLAGLVVRLVRTAVLLATTDLKSKS